MLHKAIILSMDYYKDFYRYDKKTPLATHSYEIAMILLEHGKSNMLAVCGCLQELFFLEKYNEYYKKEIAINFPLEVSNILKDYHNAMSKINQNFSDGILDMIDLDLSKDERLLVCAKHISHLRYLNHMYENLGHQMYDIVAPENKVSSYFGYVISVLLPISNESIYWELSYQYKKLFIRIYKLVEKDILIKTNGFKSFVLKKESPIWQKSDVKPEHLRNTDYYEELVPKNALFIEAEWSSNEKNYEKVVSELMDRIEQEEIKRHVKFLSE